MGVREQIIFPEIDYDKIEHIRGLNIVITTTAKTDEEGRALLLSKLGMPFREQLRRGADAWQRNRLIAKARRPQQLQDARVQPLPPLRAAAGLLPPSSACAASVCVSWRTRASSPA